MPLGVSQHTARRSFYVGADIRVSFTPVMKSVVCREESKVKLFQPFGELKRFLESDHRV